MPETLPSQLYADHYLPAKSPRTKARITLYLRAPRRRLAAPGAAKATMATSSPLATCASRPGVAPAAPLLIVCPVVHGENRHPGIAQAQPLAAPLHPFLEGAEVGPPLHHNGGLCAHGRDVAACPATTGSARHGVDLKHRHPGDAVENLGRAYAHRG